MNDEVTSLPELPRGWTRITVKDVSILVTKGSTPTSYNFDYVPAGINFIKVENLRNGRLDRSSLSEFITKDTHDFLKRSQLVKDNILFSIAGTIGKVAIVHSDDLPANINQAIAIIRCPWEFVNPDYLKIVFNSQIARSSLERQPRGVGMNNVSLGDVKNIAFLLPPLPEQQRIVAKIEELFTRLDAGVEALNKIKSQLKRYRQSVLKHAFEGKLTEEWRQAHKDGLDPASILLERIKQQRHEAAKDKFKELPPLDTPNLPGLPEGWVWTRMGEACLVQGGYAFKSKDYKNSGIPLLRISNISEHKVTFDKDTVFLEAECKEKYTDFLVMSNDIVIALSGATTGKFGIYDKHEIALLNQRVGRLKYYCPDLVSILYFFYYMEVIRQDILKRAYGAAQPNISTGDLAEFMVPLPPLPEQHRIVEEVERRFSVADQIEKTVDHSLKEAERLRHSILKRAFEGKLVPQDSNDEPAEKLLERIRQGRARQQTERKPAKSSRNKSNTKQMRLV